MSWYETVKDFITNRENIWMLYVFGVVFATLFTSFIFSKYIFKLQHRLEHTKSIWDDALVWAISRPFKLLIWVYGATYAAQVASVPFTGQLYTFRQVSMVVLVAWLLMRFSDKVEEKFSEAHIEIAKIDQGTAASINKLVRIAIFVTAGLLIMQILGINIATIVAFGGAGTVIVGFAAKDLLANFFGALMIHLDRPFHVGDWIRSPDKNIEGTVENIGWRMTRIRTFSKTPLYVPNSVFSTIIVDNPSRMSNRRIREVVGLRYQDMKQVDKVTRDIKDMLMTHPEIDTNMACFVNLNGFGPSSLDLLVYTFTKTTQWIPFQEIKQDVMLRILKIIEAHGAEVAFPTTTLDMPESVVVEEQRQAG